MALQRLKASERDIKHYHEFLPKDLRPIEGERYMLSMNDEPTCIADVTTFDGGCWATVRVVQAANERYQNMYRENMEFDIKVAHYGFQHIPGEGTSEAEAQDRSNETTLSNSDPS